MVARDQAAAGQENDAWRFFAAVFLQWRRWLTRSMELGLPALLNVVLRAGDATYTAASAAATFVRTGRLPEDEGRSRALARAGVVALTVGVLGELAAAILTGQPPAVLALMAAWTAGWALARLLLFESLVPLPWRTARTLWAAALLPWLFAVAAPLAIVAMPSSMWLAWRGAEAAGVPRRDAVRAVGLAWGAQLALELLILVVVSGYVLRPLFAR